MPDPIDLPVAGAPSDNTTLVAVLDGLGRDGFTGDLFVTDEGRVRCGSCRVETAPEDLSLDRLRRVEGASDPADMAAVLAITCPHCGARGTAVVRFGPEAGPADATVLKALDDRRYQGS